MCWFDCKMRIYLICSWTIINCVYDVNIKSRETFCVKHLKFIKCIRIKLSAIILSFSTWLRTTIFKRLVGNNHFHMSYLIFFWGSLDFHFCFLEISRDLIQSALIHTSFNMFEKFWSFHWKPTVFYNFGFRKYEK